MSLPTYIPRNIIYRFSPSSRYCKKYFFPHILSIFFVSICALGKSAFLNCRVKNLGNKTVSWIRHRDIHILTVGSYTYTSDQRFQATHHKETDDWTLQIKWAQKRDSGGEAWNEKFPLYMTALKMSIFCSLFCYSLWMPSKHTAGSQLFCKLKHCR